MSGQTVASSQAQPAEAATLTEEVHSLRAEVKELRAELEGLRQIVKERQTPAANTATEVAAAGVTASPPPETTASVVGTLQSQVAELAQTKAESASKFPVKIYGTILSTTFFNSRAVNWADQPFQVIFPPGNGASTGSFSSSLRQSRLGVIVDGPTVGRFKTSGVFAVDFNGGQTDFRSSPLFGLANIVYGYVRLESSRTAIEAGQDELIFAPHNPTSLVALSYPALYRAGNLYVRTPQVRLEQSLVDNKKGRLKLTAGLVAPVGTYPVFNNPNPAAAPPAGWQRPAIQGRLSWQSAALAAGNETGVEVGASGHYGHVDLGQFSAASWGGSFDFNFRQKHWGVDGEGFLGQNLQAFGGGIGQPGKTIGGYLETRFLPTSRLQFNTGFGTDHLTKFDVISVPLRRNSTVFANTIYQFTPEVGVSLEYRYLFASPFQGLARHNNNINLGISYSF